ncbi:hypothetical protein [Selenomonas sp. F0473]|uniref:hypothetical protein n=1 Tax=Selenomonas sp. F0473 TaxID=999423 RepID=UPI00029E5435|nr:hypothetical protein [Selenomonas sp. F0473]EKU70852.1 hypothetical protein HMPREF9161_01401 [Selenomonas sp. F0473]
MRKILCFLVAATAFLCTLQAAQAAAAPALTRIVPGAIWSEETSGIDVPEEYPHRLPAGIVFRGENLYIKTYFIGYPAWASLAYRVGTETGRALDYAELSRVPLTDNDRIVIGYVQTVMIPFRALGAAEDDLCITADGAQGGSRFAYICGICTERAAAR